MPGRSWPTTSARRMPSPRTATSWEVMPPLATTQAGRAARAAWTTSTTAVDTVREMARLSSASPPRSRVRLVNSSTSEVASASATCSPISATWALRRSGSSRVGTCSSFSVRPPRCCATATCRLVRPTCEPTTTSPCPPGRPLGQICAAVSGRCGFEPGQRANERRAAPVPERPTARLRLEQRRARRSPGRRSRWHSRRPMRRR